MIGLKEGLASLYNRTVAKKRNLILYFANGIGLNHMSRSNIKSFPDLDSLLIEEKEFAFLGNYLEEARKLFGNISARSSSENSPARFNAGENFAAFIYSLIREMKPQSIIETGVANGITTQIILSAINGSNCELHSFDTNSNCANVSTDVNWKFHLLKKPYTRNFKREIKKIGKVDLWIHDSDHSSKWQKFEYRLAIDFLKPNGVLISDDIDASPAFAQISKERGNSSFAIFDKTKFFGFLN